VIAVTGTRADALARLDVFVGEWVLEARFPCDQPAPASAGGNGAMALEDRVWTLTRESPDFTPPEFRQRFTGTFGEDGNTISGAWEKGVEGSGWQHDFALTYRRAG
jgi:hypothetical protein